MKEETVGSRIRVLRKFRGMTQETLAEKMYTKACTISNYENDQIELTTQKIRLLADILGVKAGYFFGDEPLGYYVSEEGKRELSNIDKDAEEAAKAVRRIKNEKIRRVAILNVKNMVELDC